ncbi:MAG TPA: hypothetical protein VFB16_05140 [Bauldia sp.]|nr:hypothetical protein [Bauldia sp.]
MAEPESLARGFFKEGLVALLFEGAKWLIGVGSPLVVGAVTAGTGYYQGLPIAYVITATTIALAMTATALLRFDDWRARRTAANKVVFLQALMAFEYERDPETGSVIGTTFGQFIFVLPNSASFPISIVVDELDNSIDGRVNTDSKTIRNRTIEPGAALTYRPDRIDLAHRPPKETIEGRLKFKMRYGRFGKEKYQISKHVAVTAKFNRQTGTYEQLLYDVPE